MNVAECKNSKKYTVTKVLILVLAVLFKSSIGNTFWPKYCYWYGIDTSFHRYCEHLWQHAYLLVYGSTSAVDNQSINQ